MKVFFVFSLVLLFGVVSSLHEYNTVPTKYYDEFFLVQQWPASFCSGNRCPSIPLYFTVHGLWAQLKSGHPVTCTGNTFNFAELHRKTKLDMRKFWPNLFGKKYYKSFWAHEYDTHASCISPFQNDQDKYFSLTLQLATNYNVTTMLENAGIHPGTSYSIPDIEKAIFHAIKVNPMLRCNMANYRTVQLYEIYLCVNKTTLEPSNCTRYTSDENCQTQNVNSLILFPYPWCPIQPLPFLSSTGKWTKN